MIINGLTVGFGSTLYIVEGAKLSGAYMLLRGTVHNNGIINTLNLTSFGFVNNYGAINEPWVDDHSTIDN